VSSTPILQFSANVQARLSFYVYRLIDPRNGETFYVGKGKGNRVFEHVLDKLEVQDPEDKLQRVRAISQAGLQVGHIIHRHGMDEKTALEVEAALIDAYPGLTNLQGGIESSSRGSRHASEVIRQYQAKEVEFAHKAMLVNLNQSSLELPRYEAARFAWKASISRAKRADLVLALSQGMVCGVFVPHRWLPATSDNFPGRESVEGRIGFEGVEADPDTQKFYLDRRIPDTFRRRGASNPVRYSYQ